MSAPGDECAPTRPNVGRVPMARIRHSSQAAAAAAAAAAEGEAKEGGVVVDVQIRLCMKATSSLWGGRMALAAVRWRVCGGGDHAVCSRARHPRRSTIYTIYIY